MEFLRERVFTSLNADELKEGDKVIVANNLRDLKEFVRGYSLPVPLDEIIGERWTGRFRVGGDGYALAYLVERAGNCTNCGRICSVPKTDKTARCWAYKTKTEKKAEPHFRPFKNIDELVKVWVEKTKPYRADTRIPPLIMPLIWVREKGCDKSADLITCYGSKGITVRGKGMYFDTLFTMFEFLDGSPCGVEE